jgi:glutathione peroxidase
MKIIKLKRTVIVILLLATSFWIYVEVVNRNTRNMTVKQKVLKAIYPLFTSFNRLVRKNTQVLTNKSKTKPPQSIYDLSVQLNDGTRLSLDNLKGKKILLVNTASDCGYTGQYVELQKLYQQHKEKLVIIAFPANDFQGQEQKTDEEIEKFCTLNFGVSFPLAAKSVVIRSPEQNEVYKWLTDKTKNGWSDQAPSWNFSKYLVDERGILTSYFDPAVSPLSDEVLESIIK